MIIYYKNRKISVRARKLSPFGKFTGLMFKINLNRADNLLFEFDRKSKGIGTAIHSFFVFFSFLAIWLDKNNRVVGWKIVKPFTLSVRPGEPFLKLIEIPLNKKNKKIIAFFVGERKI